MGCNGEYTLSEFEEYFMNLEMSHLDLIIVRECGLTGSYRVVFLFS